MEGTEAYFDVSDRKSSSFVADIAKSKPRNDKLREVVAFLWIVLLYIHLLLGTCESEISVQIESADSHLQLQC